ncbi:hypothetical protein PHLCEN_2v10465 [Hermanssonia centrifuga]|uniref:Cytochrome P450 n=1 Tax=Hermanssonia centrifuga TaxID=98765 RepID=A0A2R6NNB9_9APHY|nr:hypothetical protein PHLCEN_2v10465 [Hermanssonia centrifuga]
MWLVLGLLVFIGLYLWSLRSASKFPVPPGPKPLPLLGNIFDLTTKELWLRVTAWAEQYGEVAFARYGDYSRRQRRLMNRALGPSAVHTYHPLIETETHALLKRILADPQEYLEYIRRYAGGLTLNSVYGYQAHSNDDKFLNLANEAVDLLSNEIASGGGIWPVDVFPFLRHLPVWLPGTSFKRKAIIWRSKIQESVDIPYEYVLARRKAGNAGPCFVTTALEGVQDKGVGDLDVQRAFDIRWTANSMYAGSLDTTITTVQFFILAMVLNPEALAKAQKEIDTVVGTARLPEFSDRESLPYIKCVMNEVLRWGAPVPLGYRKMLRNETIYPDPASFNPDRYLAEVDEVTAKRRDPRNYVFGFGRRRCPGTNLVESSLWMVIVSMIATLSISKAKDESGCDIEPKVSFDNAVFRYAFFPSLALYGLEAERRLCLKNSDTFQMRYSPKVRASGQACQTGDGCYRRRYIISIHLGWRLVFYGWFYMIWEV